MGQSGGDVPQETIAGGIEGAPHQRQAPAFGRGFLLSDIDISVGVRPIALPSEAGRTTHSGLVGTFGETALWFKVAASEPALLALTYAVSRIPP
ncbi:hypothetical protein MPL3356_30055 [Mesorhizobium plurifarium]|uniref:Uncharacterized protein n=1 Tax=Mesorhizobium plurifarium TaxID=69974 RepID=A0A090FZZ8_MESPL|nr:hypothetical protein MPL3356_30055 [Mesorhizobium plurifarium]CDX48769.1 hypothetical protein MPL1032_10046 [Mesorhizobium plurifarium]CDX53356.1 hypothetical protein MPL3365_180054 [Mesorhizobium plurifarium]